MYHGYGEKVENMFTILVQLIKRCFTSESRSITIDFEKSASTGNEEDDLEPLAPTIDNNDIEIDDEFHIVEAATVSPMFLMKSGEAFRDHTTDTGIFVWKYFSLIFNF